MTEPRQIEWNRVAALVATIAVLFFFTRSAPFPATTYWELMLARDFDLSIGAVFLPETMALDIVNSSASLLGLKAVYHIAYFLLSWFLGQIRLRKTPESAYQIWSGAETSGAEVCS